MARHARDGMEWLEIIGVESAGPKERIKILELCTKIRVPRSARLTVYGNSLSNELSIHIQWEAKSVLEGARSPLGRELCRALSDFGFVAHNLWRACNQPETLEDLSQKETRHQERPRQQGKKVREHLLSLLVKNGRIR